MEQVWQITILLYTTGIGSSTIKSVFGGMDIIEGGQDIYYGWNGDIDTETINYLKDVLGEKAYNNIEKYATITMDFTMFADFVLAVDSWVNGFGMLSGETEMAGEMAALESLENVELAEIESVELANAETVTIETVEGEVVEIEAAAECGSSIGEAGLVENEIKGGSEFAPSKIYYDKQGNLTNGSYTINDSDMLPHKNGTLGKSQFLSDVDAEKAVLDAAEYADKYNLWETNTGNPNDFACKAKVYVENGPVGITGDGKLTNYINVYRTKTGQVHGCPGN